MEQKTFGQVVGELIRLAVVVWSVWYLVTVYAPGFAEGAPIVNPGFTQGLTGWRTGGEEDVTLGLGGVVLFVHLDVGAETALFQDDFDPLTEPLHYLVTFRTGDPDGLNYIEVGPGGPLDPWGVRIDASMPGPVEVVIPVGAESIFFLLKQEGEGAAVALVEFAPFQSIPLPATLALVLTGAVALAARGRRDRGATSARPSRAEHARAIPPPTLRARVSSQR